MTAPIEGRTTVGMVLIKSEEAEAALEYLRDEAPHVRISDPGPYYLLETETEIHIDVREVAEYLGRPLPMPKFLVSLSTFYGRINVVGDDLTVTSEMLQMQPNS